MTFLQAIILGILQGLTEFLPISSSAHLVIAPFLLGWSLPENQVFVFDVIIQVGTLIAVIVHFWSDLMRILRTWMRGLVTRKPFDGFESRMGWYLILSTIPAGILGLLIKDYVESIFNNPTGTAGLLFITALFLIIGEKIGKKNRNFNSMSWIDAIWIGFWQALSIFPGISRSGSTITGGMTRNLDRESSTQYAFLMAVPIMLAAGVMSIFDLIKVPALSSFLPVLITGFVTSAVFGYLSIRWLLQYVSRKSFLPFAIYCVILGSLTLVYGLLLPKEQNPGINSDRGMIKVNISPSLIWSMPYLPQCSQGSGVVQIESGNLDSVTAIPSNLLILKLGDIDLPFSKKYILGSDEILFIVNRQSTLREITRDEIEMIFSGQQSTQADGNIMHLYVYPETMDIQKAFSDRFLPYEEVSGRANLVYTPDEALNAISNDPLAIGYISGNNFPETYKDVAILLLKDNVERIPIVAGLPDGSGPFVEQFLDCLQAKILTNN